MIKLEDEIKSLKARNKNLLRKLKGVRLARKRDAEKAEKRLNLFIDLTKLELDAAKPDRLRAANDYLMFQFRTICSTLVESGKITLSDWVRADEKAARLWKGMHK